MKHKIILFLSAIILINGNLVGNNEMISSSTVEDNKPVETYMDMDMEIDGTIQLYSVLKEEIELIDTELISDVHKKEAINWSLAYNRDYFIGYSDTKVEAITPSNFKRIAKKYFADLPELAANIGKKGFRYKNLPTIILYYNKRITKGEALTKKDKLLVKDLSNKARNLSNE